MAQVQELTNSLLKSLMTDAVADRNATGKINLDDTKTPGCYMVGSGTTGDHPVAWGLLLVLKSYFVVQLLFSKTDQRVLYRIFETNKGWNPWVDLVSNTSGQSST